MSFKSMVEKDCDGVFLNTEEFAEKHTIWYDGDIFADVPVLLTKIKQKDRPQLSGNNMDGIHIATVRMHIALKHLNGIIPEQGRPIEIDDGFAVYTVFKKKFRIVESNEAMGMISLELEAYDE